MSPSRTLGTRVLCWLEGLDTRHLEHTPLQASAFTCSAPTETGLTPPSHSAREPFLVSQHHAPHFSASLTCHCLPSQPSYGLFVLQHHLLLHIPSLLPPSFSLAPQLLLAPPTLCFRGFYKPSCNLTPPFLLQLITASCARWGPKPWLVPVSFTIVDPGGRAQSFIG